MCSTQSLVLSLPRYGNVTNTYCFDSAADIAQRQIVRERIAVLQQCCQQGYHLHNSYLYLKLNFLRLVEVKSEQNVFVLQLV